MNSERISWTVGFSVALLLGLSIAISIFIIELCNEPVRKRKRKQTSKKKLLENEKNFLKSVNLDGMKISEFERLYEKLLKKDFLFNEFNALLSRYRLKDFSKKAVLKINENKNFFETHIPFQENVVEIGSRRSDYINASWIKGFETDRSYIITQVPLSTTVTDFWKMIWIYKCPIIVMLGREISYDRIIVDYLNPSSYSSPFEIHIKEIKQFNDFIKRTICLYYRRESREIIHFQFTTWTHLTVANAQIILELRRQMKMEWSELEGPVVVHCLSGCGRSGAFVAICNLCDLIDNIKKIRSDDRISVAYEVMNMRENRVMSIANLHQYSIVYETTLHYIVAGITSICLKNLEEEMQFLSIRLSLSGISRFQRQFENANKRTRPLLLTDCAGGIRAENQSKNRIFNIIPRDCDRPYLKNVCVKNTSDYINAVLVDGYNLKGHFIVTQWPMENTTNDVWRLLFDKKIHVAVLVDVFEHSKEYPVFWPNTLRQSVGCGTISVKLIKDHFIINSIRCQVFQLTKIEFRLKESDICVLKSRNVEIKMKYDPEQFEVAFFHLINWGCNKAIPDNLENVIDLVCLAEEYNTLRSHLTSKFNSPIVLFAKNGIERAGILCVLSECLENIQNSNEVDIYSAVVNVKRNRPQLIPTLEEYLLCYELCLEYFNMYCIKGNSQTDITSRLEEKNAELNSINLT